MKLFIFPWSLKGFFNEIIYLYSLPLFISTHCLDLSLLTASIYLYSLPRFISTHCLDFHLSWLLQCFHISFLSRSFVTVDRITMQLLTITFMQELNPFNSHFKSFL